MLWTCVGLRLRPEALRPKTQYFYQGSKTGVRALAGLCGDLSGLTVPCPLDPAIELRGIVPAACTVFKSALLPLKLVFRTEGAIICRSRKVMKS